MKLSLPESFACFSLHILLVGIHVALLQVYLHHYEHKITASGNTATTALSLAVRIGSQVIATILTMFLVLFTQQLSLKRNFHVRQTLTALHDKSNAWLGLGSAFLTLYQQKTTKTSPWYIVAITMYLLGIFILHITTPALFDVIPFTQTALVTPINGTVGAPQAAVVRLLNSTGSILLPNITAYPDCPSSGLISEPCIEQIVASMLNLNAFALYIGLSVSGLLFLFAWLTTRGTGIEHRVHCTLDAPGILQMTWLLGKNMLISTRLASRVKNPEVDHLRSAGLFYVQLSDPEKGVRF
ncbi:hypothetical protein CERSUDRAFT_95485 [Gelatoporia subvermispora B]|uniref:Uncharacterized protein n=1 Tax=Ceriporiopsis subvermispora (strain B) TaxID=914234 RepID=M2QYJ4_CERS8|nr:hypothetical protein CERSUDRAFT_95485 [Gelatoporia subvermispora B]